MEQFQETVTFKNKEYQYFVNTYPEHEITISRFNDYIQRVLHNHKIVETRFLNQIEQEILSKMVNDEIRVIFDGGIKEAVYQKAILIPSRFGYEKKPNVVLLKAKFNPQFARIEHKHVLGTLVGNGIQREFMGDIIVLFDHLIVACDKTVAPVIQSINKIYKTTIQFEEIQEEIIQENPFSMIEKIVASLRLDVLVSSLANVSRSEAVSMIESGCCLVNYQMIDEKAKICQLQDQVVIRKYGKYQLVEIKNKTKKDNLVLVIKKFV